MSIEFTRVIDMSPAFDKRSSVPGKNYGIHGVDMRMVLKGPKGAVQFLLFTNWFLPHTQRELDEKHSSHSCCHPIPADLGYHSLTPMYEDHGSMGACEYLGGATCYYDGSGLNAEPIFEILLREGSEGVWKALEAYYTQTFEASA
jgi:hypothetical protein